ncbi:MAG: beta-galactosidase [Planctomycetaceae bacterium]|nr:beta-galactosidase [Planctomycetaceae bacterium]
MYIGADYYPEHWDKKRWPVDAGLMKKAGFNVTRLAEFAWVMMEPEEGRYDFAWLDEALEVLGKNGVSAILCTPTAIVPAWMKEKYPEVMAQGGPGAARVEWGVRKDQCYSSGTFRLMSQRITRAMAEHYAAHPNVIGWQTDNEFGGTVCWCHSCRRDFQDFLRSRYGTIDAFNKAMGKHFWGHYVKTWEEIELPAADGSSNPSLGLEWKRFYTWQNVRFQRDQVKILREVCPKHFITHNLMGYGYGGLNYFQLSEDLDHVSWDSYPLFYGGGMADGPALAADLMRGCKKKNFWIMETSSGPHGWGTYGRAPRPGEMQTWAFQQFAHGCEGYIWFRWRACTAGREQYWHGILGHDGKGGRRYRETASIARELRKIEKHLAGTTVKPKVAFIYSYDSRWAVDMQPGFSGNSYMANVKRYYNALLAAGVNADMIQPGDDLTPYKLVFAPDWYVMPDAAAKQVDAFVKAGGVFCCDIRTGVKDETSLCHARTLPGLLSAALGIEIEEYESTLPEGYAMTGTGELAGAYTATQGADWVTAKGAEIVAGYEPWHMKKFAAVTRNAYGKGIGWYCGTVVKEPEFYHKLIAALLADAKIRPVVTPPPGVEASMREGAGKKLLFLMNYTEEPKIVFVPAGKKELLTGAMTKESIELPRFGVAVVKL